MQRKQDVIDILSSRTKCPSSNVSFIFVSARAFLQQNAEFVETVRPLVLTYFQQAVMAAKIPTIKGSKKWGTYQIDGVRISELRAALENLSVTVGAESVQVVISGVSADVTDLTYYYDKTLFPKIEDSGAASAQLVDLAATFSFPLTVNGSSALDISTTGGGVSVTFQVTALDVQATEPTGETAGAVASPVQGSPQRPSPGRSPGSRAGSEDWVNSVVVKVMKERIKDTVEREVRKAMDRNIVALSQYLVASLNKLSVPTVSLIKKWAHPGPLPAPDEAPAPPLAPAVAMAIGLKQQLNTVQSALDDEVAASNAAQQVLSETETTMSERMNEQAESHATRINALEKEMATLVATHTAAMQSTEAAHADALYEAHSLDRSQLLVQLAEIQQALEDEIAKKRTLELASAESEVVLAALVVGKTKRVEAYTRRARRRAVTKSFVSWAELVAFDVAERRRVAEAVANEIVAAEASADETHAKLTARLTQATEAHATRAYELQEQVEMLSTEVTEKAGAESSMKLQLAAAEEALANRSLEAVVGEKTALQTQLKKEQEAHSEYVAAQQTQMAQMREAIASKHAEELADLKALLESERLAKETVAEALMAEQNKLENKAKAVANATEKLADGNTAVGKGSWQDAIDVFEEGLQKLGDHDPELTCRLEDAQATAKNKLARETKARQDVRDKIDLGKRTAEAANWSTAIETLQAGLRITGTNDPALMQSLKTELADAERQRRQAEATPSTPEGVSRFARKRTMDGYHVLGEDTEDSKEYLLKVLAERCCDTSKPSDDLITLMTDCLKKLPADAMLTKDSDGFTPLHLLCKNPLLTATWLKVAVGSLNPQQAMLTRSSELTQATPLHLLCENKDALTPELLKTVLNPVDGVAVMTDAKDAKGTTPLDRLADTLKNKALPSAEALGLESVGASRVAGLSWQSRVSSTYADAVAVQTTSGLDGMRVWESASFNDAETAKWLSVGLRPLLQDAMAAKDEAGVTPLHALMEEYMQGGVSTWSSGIVCVEWLSEVLKPLGPQALLSEDDSGAMALHILCGQEALPADWLYATQLEPLGAEGMLAQDKDGNTALHFLCKKPTLTQGRLLSILAVLSDEAMLMRNAERTTPLHLLCENSAVDPAYLAAVLEALPAKAILTPGEPSCYRCLEEAPVYEQANGRRKKSQGQLDVGEVIPVDAHEDVGGSIRVRLGDRGWATASAASGKLLLEPLDGMPLDCLATRLTERLQEGPVSLVASQHASWRERVSRAFVESLRTSDSVAIEASKDDAEEAYIAECIERILDGTEDSEREELRLTLEGKTADDLTEELRLVFHDKDTAAWLSVGLKSLLSEALLTENTTRYVVLAEGVAVRSDPAGKELGEVDELVPGEEISVEQTRQVRGSTWVKHQHGWSELADATGTALLECTTPLHDICTNEGLSQGWLDAVLAPLPAKAMLTRCEGSRSTPLDKLSTNVCLTADWLALVLKPLPASAMEARLIETLVSQKARSLKPGPLKDLLMEKHVPTASTAGWGSSPSSAAAQGQLERESKLASAYVIALCDYDDDGEQTQENKEIAAWLAPMVKPHFQAKLTAEVNEDSVLHKLTRNSKESIGVLVKHLAVVLQLLPKDSMLLPGKNNRTPLFYLCERPRAQPNDSLHVGGLKEPHIAPRERWEDVPLVEDEHRVVSTQAIILGSIKRRKGLDQSSAVISF